MWTVYLGNIYLKHSKHAWPWLKAWKVQAVYERVMTISHLLKRVHRNCHSKGKSVLQADMWTSSFTIPCLGVVECSKGLFSTGYILEGWTTHSAVKLWRVWSFIMSWVRDELLGCLGPLPCIHEHMHKVTSQSLVSSSLFFPKRNVEWLWIWNGNTSWEK